MSWDKKSWIEKKVQPHLDLVQPIKNDGETVSNGKLWSLKKEIFIYEYIQPYVTIFRSDKNHFQRWCYFDPFSGSGMYGLQISGQTVKFPGSPLLTYSRHEKYSFSDYYIADGKKKNRDALATRMETLFPKNGLDYHYSNFSESVKYFDTLDRNDDAVLAIIDPPGFSQIPFQDVQQILEFPTVDVFLTVMTSGIQRNLDVPDAHDALTSFFGDEKWEKLGHAENIVEEYKTRLESATKKKIEKIEIFMENQKIYDLFYVSGNAIARKILHYIASKLEKIQLNDLTSIVSMQSPDVKTLFDFEGFNQSEKSP